MVEQPRDQRVGPPPDRARHRALVLPERGPQRAQSRVRRRPAARCARPSARPRTTGLGILKVGDPMLDLFGLLIGGLVSGFTQGRGERRARRGDERADRDPALARSCRIYRRLRVRADDGARRQGGDHPDRAARPRERPRIWRAELRQRERRELAIVEGLDPRDRDYEAPQRGEHDPPRVRALAREPPRLQLSAITAALRGAAPASRAGRRRRSPRGRRRRRSRAARARPRGAAAARACAAGRRPDRAPAARGRGAQRMAGRRPGRARSSRCRAAACARAGRRSARARRRADAAAAAGRETPTRSRRPGPRIAGRERRRASLPTGAPAAASTCATDLVLTTAQLVERASVVDVVAADGTRVLGLVARADAARNLALVQVSRPGPAGAAP